MEILHSDEGRNIEQVCSNLETNLPCLRLLISLSLSLTCVLYLYAYCFIDNMLDILVCVVLVEISETRGSKNS